MSISLVSYGGAQEVTGSKHILSSGKTRMMVDCGAFQGKREEADRKNRECDFEARSLDGVILSHAHFDHSGLLPLLRKKGYERNIYSTPATRDLANVILMDSASIQAKDSEYLGKQAAKRGQTFDWKPLYDEQDVIRTMEQFVTISYGRPFIPVQDMEAVFSDAGHILGSSTIHVTLGSGKRKLRVGFSGDLGRKGKPILRDPAPMPPVEYLVMESTYGDRLHEVTGDILSSLARIVKETASRRGKIIIPAFAVERTQDLVFYLHLLTDEKKIPDIPIFVDSPMATNATGIFRIHPECYDEETNRAFIDHHKNPFGFNSLRYIESSSQSKELNGFDGPAIIISSSGMCEAGRIQHHLLNNISDPKNTVLIVGYMAAETLGRKIQERRKEVRIFGETVPLRARVEEIKALSAHADYHEIGEFIGRMDKSVLRAVFLVHGEKPATEHLQSYLKSHGLKEVVVVEKGVEYSLD